MFNFGMTKDEILNSSLPFIRALMGTLLDRNCERLGVPKLDAEEADQEIEQELDESYPIENAPKLHRSRNSSAKVTKIQPNEKKKRFSASSKQDIISFFGDIATIEDKT